MITSEQRARRRNFIGSSDTPAIFCESPFSGPADVYLSKVREVDDFKNDAMEIGDLIEPALVQLAARKLGVAVTTDPAELWFTKGCLCANLDGLVLAMSRKTKPKRAIEAKYIGATYAHLWGEDGTDHVPDYVNLQVQHEMLVADLDVVTVSAGIATPSALVHRMYEVERNDEICAGILEIDTEFMEKHVKAGVPPTGLPPSLDALKRVKRVPNKWADVNPDDVAAWLSATQDRLHAQKIEDAAKAKILYQMDDAEGGNVKGLGKLTFMSQRTAPKVDKDKMRADGVYDLYCEERTARVLRFKEGE